MKRIAFALLLLGAVPAWAGDAPCAPSTPWATGVTLLASELSDCTWDGETVVAEGSTADANDTTVGFEDPTASFQINFPDLATTGTFELMVKEANQTVTGVLSLTTPNLLGKIDANNTAVDDDDCTGEQGKFWYDSTDSAIEFCNANAGAPATVAATSGDVTSVGDCTTADCFTGSSGTLLKSNTDLIMELDDDNNGSESFQIKDGAGSLVAEVTEAGAADFAGAVTATSFTADASATPANSYQDSDMGGTPDTNARILVNCPTGTTAGGDEDCDMDFQVQAAGTLATAFRVDTTDAGVKSVDFSGSAAVTGLTENDCSVLYTPGSTIADTYDVKSVWEAYQAVTITRVWCETDAGTVNMDVQIDDGTPADVMGTDLVCDTSGEVDTSGLTGSMADGDRLDWEITSVASSPTRLTVCVEYTR